MGVLNVWKQEIYVRNLNDVLHYYLLQVNYFQIHNNAAVFAVVTFLEIEISHFMETI